MNMRVFYKSLLSLLGFFSVQMKADTEVNVARWGTAVQSTTFYGWYAQRAVDGSGYFCSRTNEQTDPWWKLDLKNMYTVNRVTITNRLMCCVNWINGAEIRIGNDSSVLGNPVCATVSSIPGGATNSFSCPGMKGRYVTVNIPGTLKTVTFCEVGVYVNYPDAALPLPTLPQEVPTDLLPDEEDPVSQEDSCEDET
ncbi:fucolectin-like isoform X3 [Carassius carassius]|uniref:fucolectin-like isoform X3 n=1 Tax=Carassius carassius TaxID=217509 RepID=UPI0028694DBC|nr:fucolectin-like isoform X3 [Carassius carassius]